MQLIRTNFLDSQRCRSVHRWNARKLWFVFFMILIQYFVQTIKRSFSNETKIVMVFKLNKPLIEKCIFPCIPTLQISVSSILGVSSSSFLNFIFTKKNDESIMTFDWCWRCTHTPAMINDEMLYKIYLRSFVSPNGWHAAKRNNTLYTQCFVDRKSRRKM